NVMALLIIGSLTLLACQILDLDPKPYIIIEIMFSNLGGLITLVSSIPNIIIAPPAGIQFLEFSLVSIPYVITCVIITLVIFRIIYREEFLKKVDPRQVKKIAAVDEWAVITDRKFFYRAAAVFIITIFGFVISDYLPWTLDFTAMAGGITMAAVSKRKVKNALKMVDWEIIFFFIGIFLLVGAVEEVGLLGLIAQPIADLIASDALLGSFILCLAGAIISGFIDNISLSKIMIGVLEDEKVGAIVNGKAKIPSAIWALLFGANLGGNVTPIGSAATIMGMSLLEKEEYHISWLDFMKIGIPVAAIQMVIALFYLSILYFLL
ncbi:MAG: SLC13 family permease, partial [Promethearchaeota archaeon]